MKKTYLKPTSLTVKIVPQQMIALSKQGEADPEGTVYGRRGRFSKWEDDYYEE